MGRRAARPGLPPVWSRLLRSGSATRVCLVLAGALLWPPAAAVAQTVPDFSCTVTAGTPPTVRAEGLTELVGDLLLNCTGGTPTELGTTVPPVNIQILLNTNVTSRFYTPTSNEALLLIDDPAAANQRPCAFPTCAETGTGGAAGLNYSAPTGPGGSGVSNVYQGRFVNPNSVVWLGVPIDPPGTTQTRIVRITNVRVNASQLGPSSSLIPEQVFMNITGSGGAAIPVDNARPSLGFVQAGLIDSVRNPADPDGFAPNLSQCVDHNAGLAGGTAFSPPFRTGYLRFVEGFASAFKRLSPAIPGSPDELPIFENQPTPGLIDPGTETGFHNFDVFTGFPGPLAPLIAFSGSPDQGTRLKAQFNNVPAGVKIFLPTAVDLTDPVGNPTGFARSIFTAPDGSGPFIQTSPNQFGLFQVPLVNGTGQAVYEVLKSSSSATERAFVEYIVAYRADPAAGLPGAGTATVDLSFAPTSQVQTASGGPIPRFASTPSVTRDLFSIDPCMTNVLRALIKTKSGLLDARNWQFSVQNTSFDTILGTEVRDLELTQMSGPACTPVIETEVPIDLGDLGPAAFRTANFTIDFTGCALLTRWKATITTGADNHVETQKTFFHQYP